MPVPQRRTKFKWKHAMTSKKRSLDLYLSEVYKHFIAIKDDDFKQAQEVFKNVFEQVKQKMEEQCNYFKKYSSQVMYAGSVLDGIKVSRMDEFDMNVVIRLPISYEHGDNGIIIENQQPGFIKLKITNAFDHLDKQPDWEKCHKVTREWRDSEKYFLQSKFRQWLHGIVQKALNAIGGTVEVLGVPYLLSYKESGPAYTLNVRNHPDNPPFVLDVDVVPVIKFMMPRTLQGYRQMESKQADYWLAVPKPNKEAANTTIRNRCWRLSFQQHERELLKGCQALKTTIRLLKKLRDGLEMKSIASYYIKTLFLWKAVEKKEDKTYWQNKPSFLFRTMVQELYRAIMDKRIPYFWNENHNLIGHTRPGQLKVYGEKLKEVLDNIDANNIENVIAALLTDNEMAEFKKSELYLKLSATSEVTLEAAPPSIDISRADSLITQDMDAFRSQLDDIRETASKEKVAELECRIGALEDMMKNLAMRMDKLEVDQKAHLVHQAFRQIAEDPSRCVL